MPPKIASSFTDQRYRLNKKICCQLSVVNLQGITGSKWTSNNFEFNPDFMMTYKSSTLGLEFQNPVQKLCILLPYASEI